MNTKFFHILALAVFLIAGFVPAFCLAHQPQVEPGLQAEAQNSGLYTGSRKLDDPTTNSRAFYGAITKAGESDFLYFVPQKSAEIPIQVLVPSFPKNKNFNPDIYLAAANLPNGLSETPFEMPENYKAVKLNAVSGSVNYFEPFALERYRANLNQKFKVIEGQNYFIVVDGKGQTGSYVLGLGDIEDFTEPDYGQLFKQVGLVKLGYYGQETSALPWRELIGMFLAIAGFIIGLGAVTVIDFHGFLARHSIYWTTATIRSHKITKPLIWIGTFVMAAGMALLYKDSWLSGVALFQLILFVVMILNGLYLTFVISKKLLQREKDGLASEPLPIEMRNKIAVSFLISLVTWWASLALFVWYIIILR